DYRALGLERAVMTEVLPEAERDGRQQQATPSASAVRHPQVAVAILHHVHAFVVCDAASISLHQYLARWGWASCAIRQSGVLAQQIRADKAGIGIGDEHANHQRREADQADRRQ